MLCIYHGNCADGFASAWVVRKAIPGTIFIPGVYQTPPPDVTDQNVLLVDFSYKRPVLLEMAAKALSILILDHHKSAIEDLVDLPYNVTTVFDVERSGAMLTWNHFFPDENPPTLLRHIQDRDLWKFELLFTREIQAAVFSHPYDFTVWDRLMTIDMEVLSNEGMAIERKHHKDIAELLGVTRREMTIGGHVVPVANLPYTFSSDAGAIMAKGHPFAACYMDTPKGVVFSLRSAKEGVDVSKIAARYGGGGHKHAAGFTVPYEVARGFEL